MKKHYILLLIPLLILSCFFLGSIERKIGDRIDNCQPNTDCIIRITEVTDFKWDKMYVFDYGLSPEAIEEILGTPAPDYNEFKRWMVFLKDGKVVYREIEPTDIEAMVDGEVRFSDLDNSRHYSFTPETAIFKAQKLNPTGNITFYLLERIK